MPSVETVVEPEGEAEDEAAGALLDPVAEDTDELLPQVPKADWQPVEQ